MDSIERERGRVMTRPELLGLFGALGATAAASARLARGAQPKDMPACIARPEQTEGPYFVDEDLRRSDIRFDVSLTNA